MTEPDLRQVIAYKKTCSISLATQSNKLLKF